MKDFDTEFRQAFDEVMAEQNPDFDIPNNIELQEIEIEELQLDLPELEFVELPPATMTE